MTEPLRDRYPAPALMGVLNVTPDSFSDGGLWFDRDAAVARGLALVEQGAAIVDVGGESTRPGADDVSVEEELRRVIPVIERLAASGAAISIDTSKPEVARQALAAGAVMVNDVTGLRDQAMLELVAATTADVCVMHMRGTPRTMQQAPAYADVVDEVGGWLAERVELLVAAGVERERICVDPGIGFGKTVAHNIALLRSSAAIERRCGAPVLVGVSRKSMLGRLIGDLERDRLAATLAAGLAAARAGAWMLRVHDPQEHRDALAVAAALADPAAWQEA